MKTQLFRNIECTDLIDIVEITFNTEDKTKCKINTHTMKKCHRVFMESVGAKCTITFASKMWGKMVYFKA